MIFKKAILIVAGSLFITPFFAQKGKNGPRTITSTQIVNEYTGLTADAAAGATIITVTNSTLNSNARFSSGLAGGDLVMIIQMQGATINGAPGGGTNPATPDDSTWGRITNYNNCGLYEFAQVKSVPSGTSIEFDCPIINSYTAAGRVQVIRVPRYTTLTINSGGTITSDQWTTTYTGGVVAIEVKGNTVINSGGKIDVSGTGFRGGVHHASTQCPNCNGYSYTRPAADGGGEKGEGIAGYQTDLSVYGGQYGRGPAANGGGGGNPWNGGGGGGGNAGTMLWNGLGNPAAGYNAAWDLEGGTFSANTSSGGGRGGYTMSLNIQDPLSLAPGNGTWGGGNRTNLGGLGGRPLSYASGRIFMGGGGGAGDRENATTPNGGDGAGIIYLLNYGTLSGAGSLTADGAVGSNATGSGSGIRGNDGAGGAGAGGTIIVKSFGAVSAITVTANGGKGGDQNITNNGFSYKEAEGPGGGGGGGYIAISNGAVTQSVAGGLGGTTNSSTMTSFPYNGATNGGAGLSGQIIDAPFNITTNSPDTICSGATATLTASINGIAPLGTTLYWYDAPFGGTQLGSGTSYTSAVLTANTNFYVGTCPGTFRDTVKVVVRQLSATITPTNICAGASNGSAVVVPSGGTNPYTYSWNDTQNQTTANATGLTAGNYTVTYNDANGCSKTANTTIAQGAVIALTPGGTNVLCYGSNNGTATVTASGGAGSFSYSWSTTTLTQSVSNLAPATYTVTVTDANSCTHDTTVTITQPAAITFTLSSTQSNCAGNTGTATASPSGGTGIYTYSWNNTQATATATGLAPNTYTITVTDANGCTNDSTVIVTQVTSFTLNQSSTPATCGASDGTAGVTENGGAPVFTYLWTGGQTNSTATGLAAGNYTVTVTDANSCTQTAVVTVTNSGNFTASLTTATNDNCYGEATGSATPTVSGGSGNYSYSWNSIPVQNTLTATGLAAGSYTVLVTDLSNSCTDTAKVTITEATQVTYSVSTTPASCGNSNGTATVSNVAGGTGSYTYEWSNGQVVSNANGFAGGPIWVSITDGNNCVDTTFVTINNSGAGTASVININHASCNNSLDGFAEASVTGGTGPFSYSWNTSPAQTDSVVTGLGDGTYIVTVTDVNNCIATATVTITEPTAIASYSITTVDANCGSNNGSASVSPLPSGGTAPYFYTWSNFDTGSSISSLAAGTYSVLITDAIGCTATGSGTIVNTGAVQLSPSSTSINCYGGNDGTASPGVTGSYTYTWSDGQSTPVATGLTAGSYTVTVTDANNCVSSAVIAVGGPTKITVGLTIVNPSCTGNNGSINATPTGGTPSYTYAWSQGSTTSSVSNLTASPCTVTITDNKGCTLDSVITLTQAPPIAATTASTNASCSGSSSGSATVNASGGSGTLTYSWDTSPSQTTATATAIPDGNYSVLITDATGCTLTQNVTVTASGNTPTVFAGLDETIFIGASVDIASSTSAATYTWSPAVGLSCTTCVAPVATPTLTTTYVFTVTDANGCSATDDVTIEVIDNCGEVFVPTGFSPNGDGQNDELRVRCNCIKTMKMVVYDRWGQKIFESEDQTNAWDGTFNGSLMDPAVFVWHLTAELLNGEHVKEKGTVSLVK